MRNQVPSPEVLADFIVRLRNYLDWARRCEESDRTHSAEERFNAGWQCFLKLAEAYAEVSVLLSGTLSGVDLKGWPPEVSDNIVWFRSRERWRYHSNKFRDLETGVYYLMEAADYLDEFEGRIEQLAAGLYLVTTHKWSFMTSECESDCIETVRTAGRPLKRNEVVKALEASGKVHGKSTISNALARLVSMGLLVNDKGCSARGYRLPEWSIDN
jgi:hypothetical protein